MYSLYYGSAQQQRPALYVNPQQQKILVTYLNVALYSAMENTFFLSVSIFFIEHFSLSSQDVVLNLLFLPVCFLSRINCNVLTRCILNNIFRQKLEEFGFLVNDTIAIYSVHIRLFS